MYFLNKLLSDDHLMFLSIEIIQELPKQLFKENTILRNCLLDEQFEVNRLNQELNTIDKRYQNTLNLWRFVLKFDEKFVGISQSSAGYWYSDSKLTGNRNRHGNQ